MSTHPNVILLLCLKPDGLSRKTHRAILDECGAKEGDDNIKIDGEDYSVLVMESDYYEDAQITADEGDVIVYDLITYGYGERISWADLEKRKASLDAWAAGICERHKCTPSVYVTANYW